MVYTGRLVIIGKTGKNPFAGFVLASQSLAYRRMEVREKKGRITVFPREGHESDNISYPEVDNYDAIIGRRIPLIEKIPQELTGLASVSSEILLGLEKKVIVAFNGHMCKRCMENIKDGMKPEIAMDSTLFEFRGLPGDARVGGVVYVDDNTEKGILGINDIDRGEKRVKVHTLKDNFGVYTYVKDTAVDKEVEIPTFSAEKLAGFISTKIMPEMENVLAGGVCVLRGNQFEMGVYNTSTETINSWHKT